MNARRRAGEAMLLAARLEELRVEAIASGYPRIAGNVIQIRNLAKDLSGRLQDIAVEQETAQKIQYGPKLVEGGC